MQELLDQFSTGFGTTTFSISLYLINILICAALLIVLSFAYTRFGNSISNRGQLAKVLVLVGVTTFIIISIVKSSLALSLGLVGALSIVRFRTAIKEPEELGYFFMAISIGLGMGANQLLPTLLGFTVLILLIMGFNLSGARNSITQNLLLNLNHGGNKDDLIQKITAIIAEQASQLELKRSFTDQDQLSLNYLLKVRSLDDLGDLQRRLTEVDPNIEITFIDNAI